VFEEAAEAGRSLCPSSLMYTVKEFSDRLLKIVYKAII
jgi:hypothetical protein